LKLLKLFAPPLLLVVLFFPAIPPAHAQSNFSMYFGMGTARVKSNGQSYDFFGTGMPVSAPAMGGLFGIFGADYMFRKHIGFGAEYSVHFSQASYAGIDYRPAFFDFNAIYKPLSGDSRVVPEIQGGLGGENLKFYLAQQSCIGVSCTTFTQYLQSSNHFELHASGGLRIYVKGGVFIRPQVDIHWVNNNIEFGSDWVPEYTAAVGYTFGGR